MSNTDDIDKFGHCIFCHKNLLIKRVVDGKVIDMFLPSYSDTLFLLNTGSQMQVTICKDCKNNNDLSDSKFYPDIMDAVRKGWELDTKLKFDSGEMTTEQRDKILEDSNKLDINCHSENMSKFELQTKVIAITNKKVEDIKSEVEILSVEEGAGVSL